MLVTITPEKIELPAGAMIRLMGTWQDYEALDRQKNDRCFPRIKYRSGEIFLMTPISPDHGRKANVLADVVKVLLDHFERDYEAFTSITMKLPEVSGIEPDYCFYIDNWAAVAGKTKIDWGVDPSPDLVIEIDVTSYSDADDYLPYRVPEVWLLRGNQLRIYGLQGDRYNLQMSSCYFPNMNVLKVMEECLKITYERNTGAAIRELRQKLTRKS